MPYKTNRKNHDFQIAYFLAGSCHTPDGAYGLLCDLKDDRENVLKFLDANKKKHQAIIFKANQVLDNPQSDGYARLMAEYDMEEVKALQDTETKDYEAAKKELAFINHCITKLQPLRKYAHMADAEAHQAAQHEEWKLRLVHEAENHLLTSGVIPADHFAIMRMHPEFASYIMPRIGHTQELLHTAQQTGDHTSLFSHLESKKLDITKLLK